MATVDAKMRLADQFGEGFAKALENIEAKHPEVSRASEAELKALGAAVAHRAGGQGSTVREWILSLGVSLIGIATSQVTFGVAGNATYAWLV